MTPSPGSPIPIACNLAALSAEERVRRSTLAKRIGDHRQMVIETETGYAMRLPDDPLTVYEAFELALLERRCCPFLRLDFTLEPNDGPIWLTLSGGPGVKAFLAASSLLSGKDSDTTPPCA
jgi:hypothetical protein